MSGYTIGDVVGKIADKSSRQAWLVYLPVGILLTGIYFLLPSAAMQNVYFDLVGYSAVVVIIVGVRIHHPTRPLYWYVFAVGLLLLVFGDTIWTYYENVLLVEAPFPSMADLSYLAAMPCLAAGLVLMFRRRMPGREWVDLINALIIATVAGMLSWILLASPLAHD